MNPLTFKEIFSVTIDYMVERIYNNYALQIVANSFLANVTTSATFATILVEYLLARLEEMGSSSMERSNLYLKLFKLVFGSVSLFANENEQMLKVTQLWIFFQICDVSLTQSRCNLLHSGCSHFPMSGQWLKTQNAYNRIISPDLCLAPKSWRGLYEFCDANLHPTAIFLAAYYGIYCSLTVCIDFILTYCSLTCTR